VMPALAMGVPVIVDLFYLLPFYEEMHSHSPGRIFWIYPFIPAMLAGAAVNELGRLPTLRYKWAVVVTPFLVVAAAAWYVEREERIAAGTWLWTSAILTTILLAVIAATPALTDRGLRQRVLNGVYVALIAIVFLLPNAVDLVDTLRQDDPPPGQLAMWGNDPWMQNLIAESLSRTDPGGPGEFLLQQEGTEPPFRFIAYGGMYHPETIRQTYPSRRLEPAMVAILQNSRPMRLGLETTQGYNPLQPMVYQDFMAVLNQQNQDYHFANLLNTGVNSPLLDLLNVRYIVVDRNIPESRDDHRALAEGRTEVFRNDEVIVYESPNVDPRAWLVYDVRPENDGEGLAALQAGDVDGSEVAFVEGEVPPVAPPPAGSESQVTVADWTPDGMTLDVSHTGEGLLVVSEIYSENWQATVDGEEVEILQTDHALLGIPVGPGEHTVELRYQPVTLTVGMWVSGVTSIAAIAALAWSASRWWTGRHEPPATGVDSESRV
jgi:hypothetical protein